MPYINISQVEHRTNFNNIADQRYGNIIATGKTISWQEMRTYLENRIAGKDAIRPTAQHR